MARPRSPRPAGRAAHGERKTAGDLLDELLPMAEPEEVEVHQGAAVLEVGDPSQLLELAADTAMRPYLLCRLSAQAALVDPGRADELAEVLRRRGHTPKIVKP